MALNHACRFGVRPCVAHSTQGVNIQRRLAVLDYRDRYVFRVALTNARIVDLDPLVHGLPGGMRLRMGTWAPLLDLPRRPRADVADPALLRRPNGHHPIQGTQDRPTANLPIERQRIHASLPPARVAARVSQRPLLQSVASHATAQRLTGATDAAIGGATEPGPPKELVLPPREHSDAEPTPPIEPRICPHCHQGRLVFIRTLAPHTPQQAMAA